MRFGLANPRLFNFHIPRHFPFSCTSLSFIPLFNPSKNTLLNPLGFRHSYRPMAVTAITTSVQAKDKIDLTDKETQIFDRLIQVLHHFNLQTKLRVAGGWVRDKLLGKECYDIDIALDNMLGKDFCDKVNEYLVSSGEEIKKIGFIQSNPDQSKHLETATMRILDISIDFVNLRAEDYCENSRIPTMRFGTAEEDAYRRDLTINSLFYNIHNKSVEDLTGRGIADLKSGKIVTPLPPKETFLDDPLRVLRAIRFGARFGFILDENLKVAASDNDVKVAINEKVSRERIGHEVDLMISGNEPVKAITYIYDLQLFSVVFSLPPKINSADPEGHDSLGVACMSAAWELVQSIGRSTFTDEQRRLTLYSALFFPLRKTQYSEKNKNIPVVNYIFRNSLKLKASDAETTISLHSSSEKFKSLIPLLISNEEIESVKVDWKEETIDVPVQSKIRILAGLLLREIKDFWRSSLLLSTLISTDSPLGQFGLDERRELFTKVENKIIQLGLEKVWEKKPLVNGKEIMSILQLKSGGPVIREWQQKLVEWQLAHPSGSANECIDWMQGEAQSKRARTE
jgi:tRNA nucleotidyltransferase/poly(A) polymerase